MCLCTVYNCIYITVMIVLVYNKVLECHFYIYQCSEILIKTYAYLHFQSKWRMQKDRLTDEFSNALKNFQTAQRTAAEKEKASVARARAHSSSHTGKVTKSLC